MNFGQLLQFHEDQSASATLCVREHMTRIPYGVVQMDDMFVKKIEEKPMQHHYVNAGIYLLEPVLLDLVPHDQFFDMPDLMKKLSSVIIMSVPFLSMSIGSMLATTTLLS